MLARLDVQVTEEQKKWLKKEAFKRDQSMGVVLRDIIDKAMSDSKDNSLGRQVV